MLNQTATIQATVQPCGRETAPLPESKRAGQSTTCQISSERLPSSCPVLFCSLHRQSLMLPPIAKLPPMVRHLRLKQLRYMFRCRTRFRPSTRSFCSQPTLSQFLNPYLLEVIPNIGTPNHALAIAWNQNSVCGIHINQLVELLLIPDINTSIS